MATQDRNIDRNAEVARKYLTAAAASPGSTDKDLIRHLFGPRHNFRLTDLEFYAESVATATTRNRICIAKELSVVGAPQFGAAAAVTFTIEAFDQLDAGVFVTVASTAAQAFTGTEVVSDGFFGVWTIQITGGQVITTKAAALVMAFLTAADALKNAPTPDALNGLVGVLIVEASGGDFTAGTTNTDAALVNVFDTIDRGGIFVDVAISALESLSEADLDLAANRRLTVAKVGNLVGVTGDLLVLTTRSAGAAVFVDGAATGGYRKFPLQGESGPDVATGLTAAQVV